MENRKKTKRLWPGIRAHLKKTLPWAIPPILAAVLYLILFPGNSGPDSTMLQRFLTILVAIGGFVSGLLCLFFGPWGLAAGYGFVTCIALPQVLPDPWDRYFSLLYILALVAGPTLWGWFRNRKKKPSPRQPEPSLPEEWKEDADSCIFVIQELSGRVYQIIRCTGQLRAYLVGGELRGVDTHKVVNPEKPRTPGPKDLVIPLDTISGVRFTGHSSYGITVHIKTYKKRWSFSSYASSPATVEAFIRSAMPQTVHMPTPRQIERDKLRLSRREKLKTYRTAFLIAMGTIYLPWLFLKVPYKLFSVLSLLLVPGMLVFCARNLRDVSLEENSHLRGSKVEMMMPLFFASILPVIRTLSDFDFLRWSPVLLWSAGIAAVLGLFFFLYLRDLIESLSHLLIVVLLCLSFGYHTTAQLNYLLDFAEPARFTTPVVDLHSSSSTKGGTSYYVTVILQDGSEKDIRTTKSQYDAAKIGEDVTVLTFQGGLGLPYVFVK